MILEEDMIHEKAFYVWKNSQLKVFFYNKIPKYKASATDQPTDRQSDYRNRFVGLKLPCTPESLSQPQLQRQQIGNN